MEFHGIWKHIFRNRKKGKIPKFETDTLNAAAAAAAAFAAAPDDDDDDDDADDDACQTLITLREVLWEKQQSRGTT